MKLAFGLFLTFMFSPGTSFALGEKDHRLISLRYEVKIPAKDFPKDTV